MVIKLHDLVSESNIPKNHLELLNLSMHCFALDQDRTVNVREGKNLLA